MRLGLQNGPVGDQRQSDERYDAAEEHEGRVVVHQAASPDDPRALGRPSDPYQQKNYSDDDLDYPPQVASPSRRLADILGLFGISKGGGQLTLACWMVREVGFEPTNP